MLSQNTIESVKDLGKGNKNFLKGLNTYAKCYKIIDGDTIKVTFYLADIQVAYHIRLAGINTPERKQDGYQEATERIRELVEGKVVYLKLGKFDAFGRNLAEVYTLENICVNEILLNEKLAVVYKKK